MKKVLLLLLIAAVAVGMLLPTAAVAQRVNVKFVVNTSTVPDTLTSTSNVVITGASSKGDTSLTNWGSGAVLLNLGGDYWTKTISFLPGDTLNYKIRVYGGGWEENINGPLANTNRNFIIPNTDTTLSPQFWNNGHFAVGKNPGVFDKPWAAVPDSFVNVWVRVNIKAVIDNATFGWTPPDKDSVCILGGGPAGGNLDWGTPFYLAAEQVPTNSSTAFGMPAGTFYSGLVKIPKSKVHAGDDIAYKFRLGSNWSYGSGPQRSEQLTDPPFAGGNRHFKIPVGMADTTLKYVYFGEAKPVARPNPDTCVVTFNVDMTKAILKGGFKQGDTVQVQSGWFGTAVESGRTKNLKLSVGSFYSLKDTVVSKISALLDYQYYVVKNGQAIRETYYNFTYTGPTPSEAERRAVTVGGKTFVVNDTANSVTSARRQPEFASTRTLAHKVRVKYEVDIRPVFYQISKGDTLNDIQGTTNIYKAVKDSINKWGVWINGLAVGGWGNPNGGDWGSGLTGNPIKKMYDDGTHGDRVAGDSIWTMTILDSPDSTNLGSRDIVGQIFKFGVRGGDNEGGKGGFGNNHSENVVDTDTAYTIASQFGSINPAFYSAWDFDLHKPKATNGVETQSGIASVYVLEQNYPNPFNPTTKIEFALPKQSMVDLKVYNVLGQEVAALVNGMLNAGHHAVTFDARRLASGLYFYRINAGDFSSVKKMMLLK